jgi:hypothetical protein
MPEDACEFCMERPAVFRQRLICRECRLKIATIALEGSEDLIATTWSITPEFGARRRHQLAFDRERDDRPRGEIVASVAWGLLQQGYRDDPLILASIAITLGDDADLNRVGMSALEVLFHPLLIGAEGMSSLRLLLNKS